MYVPQVRLGDVTTEYERQVLARETQKTGNLYLDPDSLVVLPKHNTGHQRP